MKDDKPPSSRGLGVRQWLRRVSHWVWGEPQDRQDLLELLQDAKERKLVDEDERQMLQGALEVSQIHVRDVMIPRSQMVVLERNDGPDDLLKTIIASGHSRFPVIGDDRDEVVGILLAKDLLRFFVENEKRQFDIRECLRPAAFIPESKRLNTLLKEFRDSHNHMAIVVDEYGGVSGLLTIEDVLEQIVGDIGDEHDIEEDVFIKKEDSRLFTVRALTRIEDFNDYFGTDFSDEDFGTIGGLVMHEFGRLPRRGESIFVNDFDFKVTRADRRRIETLQVKAPVGISMPAAKTS